MILVHNSKKIIDKIYNKKQNNYHWKPIGLWYSINYDWHDWCKNNQPDWIEPYNYKLEIDLKKVLTLSCNDDIMTFIEAYRQASFLSFTKIDWIAVSKDYYGIQIYPYEKFKFNDYKKFGLWYSGWDCHSGCIWNKKAVINWELIT